MRLTKDELLNEIREYIEGDAERLTDVRLESVTEHVTRAYCSSRYENNKENHMHDILDVLFGALVSERVYRQG